MSKKNKKIDSTNKIDESVENKSVTIILSEDKNKISDATTQAKKNVDSVAYANNLVPPSKSSKSIRSLNIEEKTEENSSLANKEDDIKELSNDYTIKEEENDESKVSKPIIETKTEEKSTKSHKTLFIVSFTIILFIILFLVFSTIFALATGYKTTIIHGIKIKDIDVSGLSKEDAIAKVTSAFQEKLEKQITLKHNEYEITVFPGQFDVSFAIDEAVNMAYNKGRTRKYFSK